MKGIIFDFSGEMLSNRKRSDFTFLKEVFTAARIPFRVVERPRIIGGENVGPLLKAAHAMCLKPEDCIIVKDTVLGLQKVRQIGAYQVVGVTKKSAEQNSFRQQKCQQVLPDFYRFFNAYFTVCYF